MHRGVVLLALTLGCSGGEGDCAPTHYYPVDVAAKCVARVPVDSGCSNAPGPPVTRCSVGPDGKFYLSFEGRVFPGGRECTDAEYSSLRLNELSTCP